MYFSYGKMRGVSPCCCSADMLANLMAAARQPELAVPTPAQSAQGHHLGIARLRNNLSRTSGAQPFATLPLLTTFQVRAARPQSSLM